MDLTSTLVQEVLKLGVGGLILLAVVFYLVKRDDRLQKDDRERTDERIGDLKDTINKNKDECKKREDDMTARIRHLEDERNTDRSQLLHRATNALEIHARVLEKIIDKEGTGMHRTIDGKGT